MFAFIIILFTLFRQRIDNENVSKKYDELLDVMKNYESDIEDQRTLRHETKNEFATIKCKLQDKEDNKTIIEYIDSVIGDKGKASSTNYSKFKYLPQIIPIKLAINAPSGSPGPFKIIVPSTKTEPCNILLAKAPINPAIAAEIVTKGVSLYFTATPTPIPAPVKLAAIFPITTIKFPTFPPISLPSCSIINPIIRVENKPQAIPVKPSINTYEKNFFILVLISSFIKISPLLFQFI